VKLKYSRIYTGRVKIPPPKDRNCLIKDTALLKLHSAHDWIAAKSAPRSIWRTRAVAVETQPTRPVSGITISGQRAMHKFE